MQNKKGIKIKTKQPSLVDNIVGFFKKTEPSNQQTNQMTSNRDLSPRSTTPRKKIFNKTPEKAGVINLNNLHNKSMDNGYQITFNNQNHLLPLNHDSKSHLSPKRSYHSRTFQDTQFNRLILDGSNIGAKKSITPKKTILSEGPQNIQPVAHPVSKNNSQLLNPSKINSPVSERMKQLESIQKYQKQIQNHKRLLGQCMQQNKKLKKQNLNLKQQIQNLKKQIKSYQLSSKNNMNVQVIKLESQNPKSPFDKKSEKQISKQRKQRKKQQMKQSIPIMPQIPKQYNENRKMQQMSFMSSDLKSLSHQGSFISNNQSYLSNNQSYLSNNQSFQIQMDFKKNNKSIQLSSPFQKTIYDKTMKPSQRQKKGGNNKQYKGDKQYKGNKDKKIEKQEIGFSKTIGYIKGDQPSVNKSHNPFEQIATDSNKFLFSNNNNMLSNINSNSHINGNSRINEQQSFRVVQNKGNMKSKQWIKFNQSESSLGYSNNSKSIGASNRQSQYKSMNYRKNFNQIQKSNKQQRNKQSRINGSSILSADRSVQKLKIQQSKTYKFQDFNINQEESSYDFF